VIRRLFSGESVEHTNTDLMVAIIPHIVRRPEITEVNIRGIASGSANNVKLNYEPPASH